MNKKILIGSIMAVALLLLMPSIPAIQQKTMEDKAYSDFVEKLKDVELFDGEMKFPLLFAFVYFIARNRAFRAFRILDFALSDDWYVFIHPLLAFYGLWLFAGLVWWVDIWFAISDEFEWNWDW